MGLDRTVGLAVREPHDVIARIGDDRDHSGCGENNVCSPRVSRIGRPVFCHAQREDLIEIVLDVATDCDG